MTHNEILPQPGRDNKRPPSSTTHERNTGADAPLDAAPNSPVASEEDAVRAGLLLPEEPVRLDGCLLCIGRRVLEFHTEEAADGAAAAVHAARMLAGIPEPGGCAEALPDAETPQEGRKGGLAPAVPMNYGPANLPPKELAAVVHTERPSGVWIDLAGRRVEFARPDRANLAFLFTSESETLAAGLAAEMALGQLAPAPIRPSVGTRLRQRGVRR